MAFEPVYEKPAPECLKRLCSGQAVVEARLLPANGVAIARVLSVATDCVVTPSEVFAGEARYNGRVNFKVLFVDASGANHCMDYNADFTDKLTCDELRVGLKPMLSAHILDTDIVSVQEGEMKLACVVEVCLDAVTGESVKCLTGGGADVYTHDDRIDYCRMTGSSGENFTVTDTLDGVKATNVLLSEPKLTITRRVCNLDSVTVEGTVVNDLCCEIEDGGIISYQMVTQFHQEIAATGAHSDNLACVNACVSNYRVNCELDGEGKTGITAEYNIAVEIRTFTDDAVNAIVDAFSVNNELLCQGESVKICRNRTCETVADRVEGSVTLDMNMPMADNVLAATGARLTVSSAVADENKLTVEGIAACNILYYSAETNSKNSVAVELPFSLTVNANVMSGYTVSAKGCVTGIVTKIRRGNEIDIKADVSVEFTACSEEIKYVITELKMGEERALPTGAFAIHIARGGETLWDVAKALSTTPELVLLQNPTLTLPLAGGERVIAYRHLK